MGYESEVERRLAASPHLLPVFTSPTKIPERLREYDPELFVCLNVIRNLEKAQGLKPRPVPAGIIPKYGAWYEIHHLRNGHVMTVKYGELDERILRDVWKGDLRQRGWKVFDEIDEHNARVEAEAKRDMKNQIEAVAREVHRPFADAAWGDGGKTSFGVSA